MQLQAEAINDARARRQFHPVRPNDVSSGSSPPGSVPTQNEDGSGVRHGLVAGTILGLERNPAPNILVSLFAFPHSDSDSQPEGATHGALVPIETVRTDSTGKYFFSASAQQISELSEDGTLNVMVVASSGRSANSVSIGLQPKAHSSSHFGTDEESDSTLPLPQAMAAPDIVVADGSNLSQAGGAPELPVPSGAPQPLGEPDDMELEGHVSEALPNTIACDWSKVQDYPGRRVTIGTSYSTEPTAAVDFSYTQGADTTTSVAVSNTGGKGTWSQSGTSTQSSKYKMDYPTAYGRNMEYWTDYTFRKYGYTCDIYPDYQKYEVRLYKHEGGQTYGKPSMVPHPRKFCKFSSAGSGVHKTETTQKSFSAGAKIDSIVGFDASTQTGWTSESVLDVKLKSRGAYLCGQDDFAAGTPGRIIVAR